MQKNHAIISLLILGLTLWLTRNVKGAEPKWQTIPADQWEGIVDARVPALDQKAAAAVALPKKKTSPLSVQTPETRPAGLYEIRLTLQPSHVGNAIAFHSHLRIMQKKQEIAQYEGCHFARVHRPETRTCQFIHSRSAPLTFAIHATADAETVGNARAKADIKKGGAGIKAATEDMLGGAADAEPDMDLDLEHTLTPKQSVYYLVDKVEYRRLSRTGCVDKVDIDRIRYLPGATLKGSAVVSDVGGRGGSGTLNIYLEHNVRERRKAKSLPVTLSKQPQTVDFEIRLPDKELGYALVAEYVSSDGKDRSEAAEYFNIAANFQRVAIFGGGLATRDVVLDEETIRKELREARDQYFNATEYFAWAEDDMVEMSPATEFWSSGQTNYRMHKKTLQRQIRLAHEQGFAVSTYGKFVMSGSKGWKTAYDYPEDHRSQYHYPVGMWNGVNVLHLDRRRDRDFCIYSKLPRVPGNPFRNWWSSFMPINPDATPHMVRIAAEECVRSIEMFGWDAIRWDGHPRGAGWAQCGRSGKYRPFAACQTQTLVRYFKDIVAQKYPDFRHGYNYLLIEKNKDHKWAIEDFELDELCRGGGLLMNESIGNASGGWTFAQIAKNLQTDGDLCRERGGYYLGISYAKSRRDRIIESALWAAAGCRPYNEAMNREIRRYCTRYSQYTFDENLRRLVTPEKVLKPQNKTRLWWKPFVYETPLQNGRRQLVVNLLNIPQKETRPGRDSDAPPEFDMSPGTDPVAFELSLPEGVEATGVNLIHPRTLDVNALPLADGRFDVPAVRTWKVAVIDLVVQGDVGALASRFGPPATLGKKREDIDDTKRKEQIILDPDASMEEVNKQFRRLAPEWAKKRAEKRAAMRKLSGEERKETLLGQRRSPEKLAKKWWHGAAIPADLKLKDKDLDFGDLTPVRNGRFDIFYGRGAMDYRLRVPLAFARLNRFNIHNAWVYGTVRQRPGMRLANNVPAHAYNDFDLTLFTGIPHCAIGVKNSYALAEYVKSGGGVLFTGGEYAFGKGGYMHTVLERELLPFRCTGMTDTTYPEEPRPFEPGPDFSELKVDLDFSQRPVYWVRNQVVLRPDVKVFLKSGNRPVLVGWEVGKGRVACLLVDHRGKSSDGTTAFFDWQDWPKLLKSAMVWTAPGVGEVEAPQKVADTEYLLEKLGSTSLDSELDDLGGLDEETGEAGLGLPGEKDSGAGTELEPEKLKKRIGVINKALEAKGPKIASALATQLATVTNLPLGLRLRMVSSLQRERPGNAAKLAQKALSTASSRLHGNAYLLLALAGDVSFRKILSNPPSLRLETKADARERRRDLSLAIALYRKADLVEEGREKVKKWNKEEARTRAAYARRLGPDTAMLETSPCLGAEKIFARLAWLAYLSRHDSETYAEQFVREWTMVRQYQDYCARTRSYMIGQNKLEGAKAAAVRRNWRHLSRRFASLQELTRHDIERLLEEMPAETVSALKGARFTREIQTVYNLLGSVAAETSAKILQDLQEATRGDLATFAAARLSER